MMPSQLWLLAAALITPLVRAQRICKSGLGSSAGHFEFPSPNCSPGNYTGINSYDVGTSLTISWSTTQFPGNLALIQDNGPEDSFLRTLVSDYTGTSFVWTGRPAQPLSNGNVFFFAWYPNAGSTPAFISDYIRMIDTTPQEATTTTTTTTSTSATATPSSTSSTAGTQITGTASPLETPTIQQSGNTTRAVGIGVGVGVGAAVVIGGIAAFFLFRRRQNQKLQQQQEQQQQQQQHPHNPYFGSYGGQPQQQPPMSSVSSGISPYQPGGPPPPFSAGPVTPFQQQQNKPMYQLAGSEPSPKPYAGEYMPPQRTQAHPVEAPTYSADADATGRRSPLPAELH